MRMIRMFINCIHKHRKKFDEDYAETAQGKSWTLPEGTKAQFVRVYMYGRKDNATTTNHVVELEVYGTKPEEGEKPGVDITALIDRLAELSAVDTSNATTDSAAAFKALVKRGLRSCGDRSADTGRSNSYD